MKIINPTGWQVISTEEHNNQNSSPIVSLINARGHQFHLHPINARLIRIVHSLPKYESGAQGHLEGVQLRNHDRKDKDVSFDGFVWEERTHLWERLIDEEKKIVYIKPTEEAKSSGGIQIELNYSSTITLTWYWEDIVGEVVSKHTVLQDFKTAYQYDARTKRVYHTVCRDQSYMPLSEHQLPANQNHVPQKGRFEFIYGLGEVKGPMMKDGKRYIMEARDSLGADPQDTDPLYKICPYYLHYNRKSDLWFGLYYNTLVPSIFDFSGEHDFATGQFRSFSAERGPLDYYMLLGDDGQLANKAEIRPKVANIISQLATLVTPASFGLAGRRDNSNSPFKGWQTSPTLPPHNQFGYLASSLTLSERQDAQIAVVEYVEQARKEGFPIDSMHLSSGYCVDSQTGERNYFYWDKTKYPDPAKMGKLLEESLSCKVIINVKPWLLETHPFYRDAAEKAIFIQAAKDARPLKSEKIPQDEDRCGLYDSIPSRTLHWARGMGDTGKGSYIDFSSKAGSEEWKRLMRIGVLDNNITGFWIDNNEFSSVIDDQVEFRGDLNLWSLPKEGLQDISSERSKIIQREVTSRMGWGSRLIESGAVGAATQTMGMARATFDGLLESSSSSSERPVIVTRSAVPGIQAFAHSTWSGDNSTTWLSLKWSTKLSMSVGLSFGLGLYGHDIGGFAGPHSPSAELLIRWCQQSMWMTRFTIHSWKEISTTPWMYDDICEGEEKKTIKDILREIILFRYKLLPTLYSLYVTQYHRHGWPVIRPLLWHHSKHFECLTQDEQFLVGTHILVAPVCTHGDRSTTFFLPNLVDDEQISSDICWFDFHADQVYRPQKEGNLITLQAPLSQLPTLIREGGIYVLGPTLNRNMPSPASKSKEYDVYIFPCPVEVEKERRSSNISNGSFILFEDDGITNAATFKGQFTEIQLSFEVAKDSKDTVYVGIDIIHANYSGEWKIKFVLPTKDERQIVLKEKDKNVNIEGHFNTQITDVNGGSIYVKINEAC
ncbi:hypothetical protein L7F22_043820 [Adiantum nelumboides]|nr:hypothetical protein [Adiantum nelumboides]